MEHEDKIDGDLNLFGAKQEAFDFIDGLIQQKSFDKRFIKS